jgi:hypothetical protein
LKAPEKINANISYLYVTTGSKDPVTGPRTKEFIERFLLQTSACRAS